jgi:hypothetical protein
MSIYRTMQLTDGVPAPVRPLSEEEQAKLRQGSTTGEKGESIQERFDSRKGKKKPGKKRESNPLGGISNVIDKAANEVEYAGKAIGNAAGNVVRRAAGKDPVTVQQAEQAKAQRKPKPLEASNDALGEVKTAIAGTAARVEIGRAHV